MDREATDLTDSETMEAKAVAVTSAAATKTAVGAMVDKEVKAVVAPTPPRTEADLHRAVNPWTGKISMTPNWQGS